MTGHAAGPSMRCLAVLLLVSLALTGCFQQDDPGPEEPSSLMAGDLVKVRYVERFADGTVHASTAGDLPRNASLGDIPEEDHDPVWWLLWGDFNRYPTGDDVLTDVQEVDIDGDREVDTLARTRSRVQAAAGGQQVTDGSVSIWRLPDRVERFESLPVDALFRTLKDAEEGDLFRNVTVPPEEGFGQRSENDTLEMPRIDPRRPDRRLGNLSIDEVKARSNFTDDTEEGDLITFTRQNATLDARVEAIGDETVDVYLLVEAGKQVEFQGLWNATIVNVTEDSYGLRHDPEVGLEVDFRGEKARVVGRTATTLQIDFNDPRAGHTMVYDIEIVEIHRFREDRDLWSHDVDPAGTVNDVAMIEQNMPTIATTEGAYFTATARYGEGWFTLSPALEGRNVLSIDVSPIEQGLVFASVEGEGVLVSEDHGRTWSATGGAGVPVDVTASAADAQVLFARLPDGEILRSDDRGTSWSETGTAPSGTNGIDADPIDPDGLWAATDDGLRRSVDGGGSWDERRVLAFRTLRDVEAVARDRIYAGASNAVYVGGVEGAWAARGHIDARRLGAMTRLSSWVLADLGDGDLAMSQNAGRTWVGVSR